MFPLYPDVAREMSQPAGFVPAEIKNQSGNDKNYTDQEQYPGQVFHDLRNMNYELDQKHQFRHDPGLCI
jgi:hypothetical protein